MKNPNDLLSGEVELIEKQSLRALFIAAMELGPDAHQIFLQSTDKPQNIAEDTTREMLERLGGYHASERILGNVDYRKARFVVLPEFSIAQALFVDSKAEKSSSTARMQMSEISLRVRQVVQGVELDEQPTLQPVAVHGNKQFLTTTLLAHYQYTPRVPSGFELRALQLAAIPNGLLQDQYNPNAQDTIWTVGPHSSTREEDFRTRLSFEKLKAKALWRVQKLVYDPATGRPEGVFEG